MADQHDIKYMTKLGRHGAVCSCGWVSPSHNDIESVAADVKEHERRAPAPCLLKDWLRSELPQDSARAQGRWVRTRLGSALTEDFDQWDATVRILDFHESRGIRLPVYEVSQPGLTLLLRNNFLDWVVSIERSSPHDLTKLDLFDPRTRLAACYCEGFTVARVYGPYEADPRRFTCTIDSNEALWALCRVLWKGGQ